MNDKNTMLVQIYKYVDKILYLVKCIHTNKHPSRCALMTYVISYINIGFHSLLVV